MKYRKITIAAAVILFILNLTATAGAQNRNHDNLKLIIEKSFQTSEGKTVFVNISGGDIDVNSWNKNEVNIKILGDDNTEDKFEFELNNTDNGIQIFARKKHSLLNLFSNLDLKIEINVPESYNSNINTSGGDISYNGVTGMAELNTSGGDVDGNNFVGELNISTSGGDISLSGKDAKIDAHTSGGDIELNYSGTNRGIELTTSGGDITVRVPEDFIASIELYTSGGEVSCTHNMNNVKKISDSKLIADLNGGGNKLIAKSSGGDIDVISK
jgi:hypothetical protein